jgi:hypothetical protein
MGLWKRKTCRKNSFGNLVAMAGVEVIVNQLWIEAQMGTSKVQRAVLKAVT